MTRFYRALLRLYPASFRREYGDELCDVFRERSRGLAGPFAAAAAVADVVPSAVAAHADLLRLDLRYTLRSVRRSPAFALAVVLVVALGVGANTAAFSVAEYVLVRPLPFPGSDRLVRVWQRNPGYARMELSPANYRDWTSRSRSFEQIGAYSTLELNLVGGGDPRRVEVGWVTSEVLDVLGVEAVLGRTFTPDDAAAGGRAVLSHGMWESRFGGRTDVLGETLRLDGQPYVVTGVMPRGFHFPDRSVELWTTLSFTEEYYEDRNNNFLYTIARLSPGVSLDQAAAELDAIAAEVERLHPVENRDVRAAVVGLRDDLSQRARLLLIALCGAALCILLLACANLSNLLMARAVGRQHELAVRAALGAGRDRLVRQLATESVTLTMAGAAAGLLLAVAAMPLLGRLVPASLPTSGGPSLDLRMLALGAALIAAIGIGVGVLPAVAGGGGGRLSALSEGSRAGGGRLRRARSALVATQMLASVVLLVSAGLLIRAQLRIQSLDPGFRAEDVLTLRTALPLPRYEAVDERARFIEEVLAGVRALPGVEAAAYITGIPIAMPGRIWPVQWSDAEVGRDGTNTASLRYVTPGYFTTMGIPLLAGRDVSEQDRREQPYVAVVSESFVERYWPGEDPIGKRFTLAFDERTVAGVAGNVRVRGLERVSEPQVYLPYQQVADGAIIGYLPRDLVVRTGVPAATLLPAIRRIVAAADPEQPVSDVRTMAEVVAGENAPRRTQTRILAALAAIAIVVAAIGIHGLLSFTVSRRAHELSVRRALGARRATVVRTVLGEGLRLAAAGVVPGVLVAWLAARGMGALLAGVPPADPVTLSLAVGVCVLVALAGCLQPALRAARCDPASALRG